MGNGMRHNPQPQEMYKHFKGNMYQVRCLAKHSETGEMLVIYQAMYGDFGIYARPLAMFMEEVDRAKYPNAAQRYRFELMGEQNETQTDDVMQPAQNIAETDDAIQRARNTIETDAPQTEGEPDMQNETQEELNIDPLLMQFLEADTYERRLEILSMLHPRIDDDMINTMAVAVDIEVKDGEIEDRYEELKSCLLTFQRYECNRLR